MCTPLGEGAHGAGVPLSMTTEYFRDKHLQLRDAARAPTSR
ncbi:hypothetical protein [Alloactinosynnema sp. L-07]|nr:hypothetical protein [Alloactinosynnema sp. L-07]